MQIKYNEFVKIPRTALVLIKDLLLPGKVVTLYGPRQVGKTTLARDLIAAVPWRSRFVNADELIYREALASQDRQRLGEVLGDAELLVIDEAQRVPDIGLNLKILVDSYPHARFLATGSASFDLANRIREPLTGRAFTVTLYPIAYREIREAFGALEVRSQLERWLVWGGYPAVVTEPNPDMRARLLNEITGAYLYRDLLELEGIRYADKLVALLRLLAFQIGHDVSIAELAAGLGLSRPTVERYLDLLEKVFVIFRLGGFARNLRKAVTKSVRYYFFDNGIRNSLIQNFNPPRLRADTGQLWENYLMVERRKANALAGRSVNAYFWRTYDQKEVDYLEEAGGQLCGYEFKWGDRRIPDKTRREFLGAYPEATLTAVTPDDFEAFVV